MINLKTKLIIAFFILFSIFNRTSSQTEKTKYQPTFESLEKVNPVPEWFKDAKFGIYFHWGVYSVPAFANEWYPRNMYIEGSNENKHHKQIYGDPSVWPYHNFIIGAKDKQGNFVQFAPKLKSEGGNFDPEEWAQLFAEAGAKFAGPVAEHHDGFSMWASKVNPWNASELGPKLDLVGLFAEAIRKRNMKLFLSMHHAYNITGYFEHVPKTTDQKLQMLYSQQGKEKNEELWLAKHKEIIDFYQPDIIYQDFNLHLISQPVLLGFLSYYYNRANEWNKQVVATFKDGLNKKCAVLDYERGGPTDLTDYYWLSDDAISASSWCYTEGLTYYSSKQLLHSLIDKISKNGNLILNISPKADGTIPQEQKDILLTIGSWLRKYGEAIYSTRAWEMYGEGPTKMGAAHGVFIAPAEGTSQDVRYTRSKDNTTLYAIMLGWDKEQKQIKLSLLGADRINLSSLKSIEMLNGTSQNYIQLKYNQTNDYLVIQLPENWFNELAYVIKLSFDGQIPVLNKFVKIDCTPFYYIVPQGNPRTLVLSSSFDLSTNRKEISNQWKFEYSGKGLYKIINRENIDKVLQSSSDGKKLVLSSYSGEDYQLWTIHHSYNESLIIKNKRFSDRVLSISTKVVQAQKVELKEFNNNNNLCGWNVAEVCEKPQLPFKQHTIPGIIEAEDFDMGCTGDAYYDKNDINEGGQYRLNEGVDIEKCSAGGHNVGWISKGEFLAYTVEVQKSGTYQISFFVASPSQNGEFHLESNNKRITENIKVPDTKGFQNWEVIHTNAKLNAGKHIIKWVSDGENFNIDKINFEIIE